MHCTVYGEVNSEVNSEVSSELNCEVNAAEKLSRYTLIPCKIP